MGVSKHTLKAGNGKDYPKKGDSVTIEYTGNLYDNAVGASNHYRGTEYVQFLLNVPHVLDVSLVRFDSSKNRGPFKTAIGVGTVIKGMARTSCDIGATEECGRMG